MVRTAATATNRLIGKADRRIQSMWVICIALEENKKMRLLGFDPRTFRV